MQAFDKCNGHDLPFVLLLLLYWNLNPGPHTCQVLKHHTMSLSLHFLVFCMCARLCVRVPLCVRVCRHVCANQRSAWVLFLRSYLSSLLIQSLSLALGLPSQLGRPENPHPLPGITSWQYHVQIFMLLLEIRIRSSCLAGKRFTL